ARTRHLAAARAAGSVFRSHGLFQVYAGGVRQGRQPGKHVGELGGGNLWVLAAAQGGGQFAHFLHEPHEGPVDAAAAVLGPERVADQALELVQGHISSIPARSASEGGVVPSLGLRAGTLISPPTSSSPVPVPLFCPVRRAPSNRPRGPIRFGRRSPTLPGPTARLPASASPRRAFRPSRGGCPARPGRSGPIRKGR